MNEIFILGMPRSASTALQLSLNTCAELLIYGEHFEILRGLPAHWALIKAELPRFRSPVDAVADIRKPPKNFPYIHANGISGDKILERLTNYIEETLNPLRFARWGFKDVSYGFDTGAMLLELFPTCKILLTVRHPADVVASGIACGGWPDWKEDNWFSHWEFQYNGFKALAQLSKRAEIVYYERLVYEPEVIRCLCEWLELDSAPAEDFIFRHPKWGPSLDSAKPALSPVLLAKTASAGYPLKSPCR